MSRSGNARFKSIHYWMLCVLLVAAFVLTGCRGTGNDGDKTDSGSDSADYIGINAGALETSGNSGISAGAPDSGGNSGSSSADEYHTGQDANGEQNEMPPATELTDETGSAEDDPWAAAALEAAQDVQEIVAKPAGRKGPLPEIYDPNPDYDKYALVEYAIDDIGAEFTATVSAEDDDSEYEVHCNLGRAEQVVILDADYSVIYDRTGRMGNDAALIVQKAVEENDWREIGE